MSFYDYLRGQFTDLPSAKNWMYKWFNEFKQEVPGYSPDTGYGYCTIRAMAAHCSLVLENKIYPEDTDFTDYLSTQYGSELYNAALEQS